MPSPPCRPRVSPDMRWPALLLVLAACGGPGSRAIDTVTAPPLTPRFSDARPYDWEGSGPTAYPVHGIDISRWQTDIDWPSARAAGVNFAYMKATEGADRIDPVFAGHWDQAARAGVARGAYHFFYFCTPAADQARWFIANVPRTPGALPPVLDLEWNPASPTCTYRPPPETVRAEARTFIDIIARHYGQRPIIYTTPDFWDRNGIERLREEVWLRSTAATPAERYPGTRWTFWQYSGTGLVPGLAGQIDLNAFHGSVAEWAAWRAARTLR